MTLGGCRGKSYLLPVKVLVWNYGCITVFPEKSEKVKYWWVKSL